MTQSRCPNRHTLREFALGLLSNGNWDSIAAHVEGCPDCLGQLEALDQDQDELVEQLCHLQTGGELNSTANSTLTARG